MHEIRMVPFRGHIVGPGPAVPSARPPWRMSTLTAAELAMLVRFALLAELQERAGAPAAVRQDAEGALLAYRRSRPTEQMDCWWSFLRGLAGEWVTRARTS